MTRGLPVRRRLYHGQRLTIREVEEVTGLPYTTVRNAFRAEPRDVTARIDAAMVRADIRRAAAELGTTTTTIRKRRQRGWSLAEAITEPTRPR